MKQQPGARAALSVIIIAGMEEHNIRACIASVSWAAEIIVVHSSHDDATAAIASEYTPHVLYNPFESYAAQKFLALQQASFDWVLSVDADERVTPELRSEIERVLTLPSAFNAYSIPRKNHFHETWLRYGGWYPDRQTRLFRRDEATLSDRLVHESFLVEGRHGELSTPLIHYTVPTIRHLLEKNLEYSRFEALEKSARRRLGVVDFLWRPPVEFFVKFVLRRGFMDGWDGFVLASLHTLNKVQVMLQIWEFQHYPAGEEESSSPAAVPHPGGRDTSVVPDDESQVKGERHEDS